MDAKVLNTESAILNKKIYQICFKENEKINYTGLEDQIIKNHNPDYIQVIVTPKNLPLIHYFEIQGFKFIEFRIERQCKIREFIFDSKEIDPYDVQAVINEDDFKNIIQIAEETIFEDRFSTDPLFPKDLAKKRNIAFINKSYKNSDEILLKFFNKTNGEIIGFQTGKVISKERISLLLNVIKDLPQGIHYQEIFDMLVMKWLKNEGFEVIEGVSSASNIGELNRSIKNMNFIVVSTWVLLRKIIHD